MRVGTFTYLFHKEILWNQFSSVAYVDEKGGSVIKKDVLAKPSVLLPCTTVITSAKGKGIMDLKIVGPKLSRTTNIGGKKLKGWEESEHRGEELLSKITSNEKVT